MAANIGESQLPDDVDLSVIATGVGDLARSTLAGTVREPSRSSGGQTICVAADLSCKR